MNLSYVEDTSPDQLMEEHRQWDVTYARPLLPITSPVIPRREAIDRFESAWFRQTFVCTLWPFCHCERWNVLDKTQCSLVCYADRLAEDEYTTRIRAAADVWHITAGLTNEELIEQIRSDQIDVLVDLMGPHRQATTRLARKPAPVQITWLGYVGTTGHGGDGFPARRTDFMCGLMRNRAT